MIERLNNQTNANLTVLVGILGIITSYLYLMPTEYYLKPTQFLTSATADSVRVSFPAEKLAQKVSDYITDTPSIAESHGPTGGGAKLISYLKESVANLRQTKYVFGGSHFDTKQGVYKIDCSGLVNRVVQTTCPGAYQSLTDARRTARPTTLDYYSFLGSIPQGSTHANWKRVESVNQLKPGDILVYRYPGKPLSSPGHMMIVVEAPKAVANKTGVYTVRVADSANSGHTNDTRKKHTSGVGIGNLMLKTYASNGHPYCMSWKEGSSWGPTLNFAMGRALT